MLFITPFITFGMSFVGTVGDALLTTAVDASEEVGLGASFDSLGTNSRFRHLAELLRANLLSSNFGSNFGDARVHVLRASWHSQLCYWRGSVSFLPGP